MRPNLLLAFFHFFAFGQIPDAPWQLVDAGGVQLDINCMNMSPAVVLEAGFPGSSLDWTLVQPAVAEPEGQFYAELYSPEYAATTVQDSGGANKAKNRSWPTLTR
jgi:hypothetical protein